MARMRLFNSKLLFGSAKSSVPPPHPNLEKGFRRHEAFELSTVCNGNLSSPCVQNVLLSLAKELLIRVTKMSFLQHSPPTVTSLLLATQFVLPHLCFMLRYVTFYSYRRRWKRARTTSVSFTSQGEREEPDGNIEQGFGASTGGLSGSDPINVLRLVLALNFHDVRPYLLMSLRIHLRRAA